MNYISWKNVIYFCNTSQMEKAHQLKLSLNLTLDQSNVCIYKTPQSKQCRCRNFPTLWWQRASNADVEAPPQNGDKSILLVGWEQNGRSCYVLPWRQGQAASQSLMKEQRSFVRSINKAFLQKDSIAWLFSALMLIYKVDILYSLKQWRLKSKPTVLYLTAVQSFETMKDSEPQQLLLAKSWLWHTKGNWLIGFAWRPSWVLIAIITAIARSHFTLL